MKPTQTQLMRCVSLWAAVVEAREEGAPIAKQIMLQDRFFKYYGGLAAKCDEMEANPSPELLEKYTKKARTYLKKRIAPSRI